MVIVKHDGQLGEEYGRTEPTVTIAGVLYHWRKCVVINPTYCTVGSICSNNEVKIVKVGLPKLRNIIFIPQANTISRTSISKRSDQFCTRYSYQVCFWWVRKINDNFPASPKRPSFKSLVAQTFIKPEKRNGVIA